MHNGAQPIMFRFSELINNKIIVQIPFYLNKIIHLKEKVVATYASVAFLLPLGVFFYF